MSNFTDTYIKALKSLPKRYEEYEGGGFGIRKKQFYFLGVFKPSTTLLGHSDVSVPSDNFPA